MSKRQIILNTVKWDGSEVVIDVVQKLTVNPFTYWEINIYNKKKQIGKNWVIRRMITDLRPIIAGDIIEYCGLNNLGILRTYYKGRLYVLTKSLNPHKMPELSLNVYIRNKKPADIPIYVRRQIQKIYSFRVMMGMTNNKDTSLILRSKDGRINVYSVINTFSPPSGTPTKNSIFPEAIFNRWFETKDYNETRNVTYHIGDLIGIIRDENNSFKPHQFDEALDSFDNFLTEKIEKRDINLLWFHGDIINLIIGKATP